MKYGIVGLLVLITGTALVRANVNSVSGSYQTADVVDFAAVAEDSTTLRYPLPKEEPDGSTTPAKGMQGKDPDGTTTTVEYDPTTNEYNLNRSLGGHRLGGQNMSLEEYAKYDLKKSTQDYWKTKNDANSNANKFSLSDLMPAFKFNVDDIFNQTIGAGLIDIKVNGSIELILGFIRTRRDDPAMDVKNQRQTHLNFDATVEMDLNAKIGNRIDFDMSHNTEAMFAFDNKLKLEYEGKEDEIIKHLQAGDISFPLKTTLIQGSQNLFGLKATLQFGNTFVTGVFSEQRGEANTTVVEGGAQTTPFEFKADEYEEDRHFFIAHYFRDNYNKALSTLPIINSNVNILKMEVWVTNIGSPTTENRNIIAFTDLAESHPKLPLMVAGNPLPTNNTNDLLSMLDVSQIRDINLAGTYLLSRGLTIGTDFEKIESARRLQENEYTFNRQLGFISLNTRLNSDQVLAVAFQYQVIGDETIYQVGEFSDQGLTDPTSLVVKLLKSSSLNTKSSLWSLMMKNIYNLNAYQVSPEDFRLNIVYAGDEQGVMSGYFKDGPRKGIPLIELFGLDRMDAQQNKVADGVFDFIDQASINGGTIESTNGRIYMPYVEPFGKDLITIFGGDSIAAEQYLFKELYENTKVEAQQYPNRNKYYFEGVFKSASSNEISVGATNIPQGSVRVMAGNTPLTEGTDYTVDYLSGRVRIINEGILNSGVPITISSENNAMFNIMTKRMMGLRVDHVFSKNLNFGATLMNLHQSPITQKVNIGEAPISNTIYGFDVAYENESRLLTRLVDKILPFQSSSTVSRLNLYGEFAHFIPGHSRAIGKSGTIYVDDFEGSKSTFNLKDHLSWYLASTPQWQDDLFPESRVAAPNLRPTRFNVAKLSWYIIDRIFYGNDPPEGTNKDDLSKPYSRDVLVKEIFPNKELDASQDPRQSVLNLAYYPSEKGPYNYDVQGSNYSHGIDDNGNLLRPDTRWAGIMRKIDNTDFEANNVEYIEFWMMDPFIGRDGIDGNPRHSGGKLYFNLGDISEDVLRDGRKGFENGMPTTAEVVDVDTTAWGRVPTLQSLVRAFDNDPNSRQYQDIGYDGLSDADEESFLEDYLTAIYTYKGNAAVLRARQDPSNDNFRHFLGGQWNNLASDEKILERYKNFTSPQGNSPSAVQTSEDSRQQQTTHPNTEDINADNTLNESENYFQYEVNLQPGQMEVGKNYITNIQSSPVKLKNGDQTSVKWYQFKIPIRTPDRVVGDIQNFQSIRFVRMFLREFNDPVVLRFATLELVKSEWRKYGNSLYEDNVYITQPSADETEFNISTVNIEENSSRNPVPYVIPPGIERETDNASINNIQINEQALSMKVLNLADGDARAVYKISDLDLRQFKHLKMMIHAEKVFENDMISDDELTLFVRLGADFQDNYYEYEVPLKLTAWNTSSPTEIWPSANDVDINLEEIINLKEARNRELREINSTYLYSDIYKKIINGRTYTIKGSPSLSAVKSIMIGVRNRKKTRLDDGDDNKPKSAEIWVNELRATDFIEKSGFAVTGRAQATLGDLGNINMSGSYTSANFGQLETRLTDLQQNNVTSIDFSTNLELGKFLPPESGVKIPVHYDYSRSLNNPEYNPLDPDMKTNRDVQTYPTSEDRGEIRAKIQDLVVRQNINFMNVRKDYTGEETKKHFYDIENFTALYSYSGQRARNVDVEYNNKNLHRGGLTYGYSIPGTPVTPFANTALAKNKIFALISDFNFNYLPRNFTFNTEVTREYNEMKMQNKSLSDIIIRPTYFKRFEWLRNYDLQWDFAKSLLFTYRATANANIEEPIGEIDTREERDSIWQSVKNLGKLRNYMQTASLTWAIPINKIPLLDWVTASAGYTSNYRWEGATNATQSLGNIIDNTNTKTFGGTFDLVKLYNKIPFLKAINTPRRTTGNRPQTRTPQQQRQQQQQERTPILETMYRGFFRMLMGIRNGNFDYNVTDGIYMPGFMGTPMLLGTDFSTGLPGLPFAFGSTDDIREKIARQNLMSMDSLQNQPYMRKRSRTLSAGLLFEPFADFRIQLSLNKTAMENNSEFYKYNAQEQQFKSYSPQVNGSYQISTIAWRTAFAKDNKRKENPIFEQFLAYRETIARRVAANNPNSQGMVYDTATGTLYPYGYGATSQEVLIPSFIAAYLGKSPTKIALSAFPRIPLPNWNLSYNGLTKIDFFKKYFNKVSLQHAYRANYSVGSYGQNMNFISDENGMPTALDMGGINFAGELMYDNIVITESFSPLAKVSVELKNNFQINVEMKKDRSLALSFANNQITEVRSDAWVFGLGYVFKDVGFNVHIGNSQRAVKSDINVTAGVSIRSNVTVLRRIDQNINQASAGQKITTLNFAADYQLSDNLIVKLYYDQSMNRPELPTMFYNSTSSGGISLRFTINQ